MTLTIKPAFVNRVIGFRNSVLPLGMRSQEDLKYLLLLAYLSSRADYVNLFDNPPTLDELLGNPGGGGNYMLPTASATTLGGIKVGAGLAVTSDGTLSAPGGGAGGSAWSPTYAIEYDNLRKKNVLKVTDWIGGTGTKPAAPVYVGPAGFVNTIAAAAPFDTPTAVEELLPLLLNTGNVRPVLDGAGVKFELNWNGVFSNPEDVPTADGAVVLQKFLTDNFYTRLQVDILLGNTTPSTGVAAIPGVFANYKASAGVANAGTNTMTLANQVAGGSALNIVSAGLIGPTINASAVNGEPSFVFDPAAKSLLKIAALASPSTTKIGCFIVLKMVGEQETIIAETNSLWVGNTGGFMFHAIPPGLNPSGVQAVGTNLQVDSTTQAKSYAPVGVGAWALVRCEIDMAAVPHSKTYTNGVVGTQIADGAGASTGNTLPTQVLHFGGRPGLNSGFFSGEMAEIVLFTDFSEGTTIANALKTIYDIV